MKYCVKCEMSANNAGFIYIQVMYVETLKPYTNSRKEEHYIVTMISGKEYSVTKEAGDLLLETIAQIALGE